jgi:hypothetical protein
VNTQIENTNMNLLLLIHYAKESGSLVPTTESIINSKSLLQKLLEMEPSCFYPQESRVFFF